MSNKQILREFEELLPYYEVAYKNNNLNEVNKLNIEFLRVCEKEDKIPKNKANNLKKGVLTHIIGNSKIGEDTLCISVTSGLSCPMSLLGDCNNCNICYAKNHNKQYFKNTVPKNLINQTLINKVVLGELTLHSLLFELIYDINCSYTQRELNNLNYLRLSVEGDILNNEILRVCEEIAKTLIIVFNLKGAYSYTHNKRLNLSIAPNIVFNCSDFKNNYYNKSVFVKGAITPQIKKEILNKECLLCLGDCYNCVYCKNKDITLPIIFIKHGGEFEGVKTLKEIDLKLFEYCDNLREKYLKGVI